MNDKFVINIIHRPEMVPEYAEKVTGQGKTEDIGRKSLLTESLDIFKFQQETAHRNGLKTTIQMTYASLFNDEAIEIAKHDHDSYGDEISLSLLGLPCNEFRDKYKTKDFCIWMFRLDDKKSIVDDVFGKFHDAFGFYPESTGSYYMDADLINYIKEKYPSVKCAIATCWEEGPKAYHTCNNSWYTFMDGGPWNPWIPSRQNTHAPAANAEEDSGIVAIPHLSRDLLACYDGNGSNFGTHPQNVLRGMIYDTKTWEYPYLYNLVDQYRHLAKYNSGYAYNMMFVGPGWLNKMGRWEAPYELLKKSYEDGMAYYASLKQQGELVDMTMSEFADYYRSRKTYTEPECALWKDILYGSDKQLFWYSDPFMRACVNMDQGGAIVDLRPYVAKLYRPVGIGTGNPTDASYPFLIQEKYRAGYFTHYAGEGTIRSCKVCFKGEEVDMCLERTHASFSLDGCTRVLTLDPVVVEFAELSVTIQTVMRFAEGTSRIQTERHILSISNPECEVEINEYMVGCYGTTEYAENMEGITLSCGDRTISYEYLCREECVNGATEAKCTIPQIGTAVSLETDTEDAVAYIREGYAFSPMFTLGITGNVKEGEVFTTWLKLEKAD
ncbi:MAG: hypothetical protein LKG26_00510 [Saccharofermentans sp.]|jgi:hypothetical protein|nr:hypothetical protein [Mageeibacillus sp.]MCI1264738.1 hypothetical protein [Saccharofermentans sp.]MCI1274565.1 hypothetical protein [Saccharofermentans sp.]MCI1768948.1 hypothetical protein [Mageeibacillus sp.]MCI2043851.1 hypothetical protein [Mageeibacillus sp.]